jgi:hypothetical protein
MYLARDGAEDEGGEGSRGEKRYPHASFWGPGRRAEGLSSTCPGPTTPRLEPKCPAG